MRPKYQRENIKKSFSKLNAFGTSGQIRESSAGQKRRAFKHASIWAAYVLSSLQDRCGDKEKLVLAKSLAEHRRPPTLGSMAGCDLADDSMAGNLFPEPCESLTQAHPPAQVSEQPSTLEQQPRSHRFLRPGFCGAFGNMAEFYGSSLKPTYHVPFWSVE